jgi:hypothetical protein
MALDPGNSACTTGLSKRIYDALVAAPSSGFSSPLAAAQIDALKAIAHSVATSVVDEITANAVVSITVPAGAFGASIPPSPYVFTVGVS